MVTVSRVVPVRPDQVWAVLADGWSYAGWVVGSAHIREVDEHWPREGSRIHHQVGMWPMHVADVSTVVAVAPEQLIELEARLWLLGRARIRLTLEPVGEYATRVSLEEEVVTGPASLAPRQAQAMVLRPRNAESLARLQHLAVGRSVRGRPR